RELLELAGASREPLLDVRLGYSQSNGTDLLRSRIAALYPGVAPDQILVTTGSAEANFVVCWRLIEPGDHVAVMLPNYLQTWGLAQNFGAQVRGFALRAEAGWEPAAEEVRSAITPGTKLVVVTNPHNPTGHVLSDGMRRLIVARAAEVGAWLLADEVYQGAEREGARGILRSNYPVIERWLKRFGDTFSWHPPQAGAICLVKYRQGISALDLVERMRAEHSVLLVPGDHFGLPHHIRFGFGEDVHHFEAALAETERGLKRVF